MAQLLNRTELKRRIFALQEAHRPTLGMTRIGTEYLDMLEAHVMAWIEADVRRHPSLGHTFGNPLVTHNNAKPGSR